MSIEVIGAGLGRTGPLSLKAALESLGFSKCYHMVEVFPRRDHARIWDAAACGEPVDYSRDVFPRWVAALNPRIRAFRRMVDRLWDRMFRGRFEDRAYAIDVLNRHNEQVIRDVPAERLLVYEVSQGWSPLCEFLGVPVPEGKPFPHLNDTAEFCARIERVTRILRTVGYAVLGAAMLALVLIAVVAIRLVR